MSQERFTAMQVMATSTVTPDRSTSTTVIRKTYPNYKVIVLNDDFSRYSFGFQKKAKKKTKTQVRRYIIFVLCG